MASVLSTVLSCLNAFIDSELEQVLCFDTAIDAERFCNEKSAIFLVLPEENPTTYFLISLIIQRLYREILTIADENGGKLKNRVVFFCDELGTLPPIQSLEIMLSASRSRRLSIVPIIQSFGQLKELRQGGCGDHRGQLPTDDLRWLRSQLRNGRGAVQVSWHTNRTLRFRQQEYK